VQYIVAMARAAAQADKEADAIIAALHRASESAVDTTLAAINKKLEKNPPLMYHIHALLHNEEWTAVLEASALGITSRCGDKPVVVGKKLKKDLKKFEHLQRPREHKPCAKKRVNIYIYIYIYIYI
jgi:hypothetical protein